MGMGGVLSRGRGTLRIVRGLRYSQLASERETAVAIGMWQPCGGDTSAIKTQQLAVGGLNTMFPGK